MIGWEEMDAERGRDKHLCACGRPLTKWDRERGLVECITCWLVKYGVKKPDSARSA